MRIAKKLAACGVDSRRKCELLVTAGRVTVNKKRVTLPQTLVAEKDEICVDGVRLQEEEKYYFLLNKPAGRLCANLIHSPRKSVLNLFSNVPARLFTVGRLDKETTGLLIVTNDGDFANRIIHPSYQIQKEYLVKTNCDLTHEQLVKIGKGSFVEGTFVKPLRVLKVRRGTVKVTVMEGKKHEVRCLIAAAGLKTLSLSRIRIGGLVLGKLPLGSWRSLTEGEKKQIFA